MKNLSIILGLIVVLGLGATIAHSQTGGEPPGLPTYDDSPTTTVTADQTTATPPPSPTPTVTATVQSFEDDVETGSEIIVLLILSLVGGTGIYLIKRYFETKKYSM